MRGSIIKLWRMELGWKLYIYKRAHVACAKLTFMSSLFLSANISPPSSLPSPSSETLNFQHFPQSNTHALISKEFRKFCWILLWELENWKHFNHDSFNWCLAWIWWKLHFPICCTSDTWVGSAEEKNPDGRKFKSRRSNYFAAQFCLLNEKSMLNFETWVEVILLNSFMVHIAFKLFKVLQKRRINSVRVTWS